jgi:triosephosphate isomerase (TIM)
MVSIQYGGSVVPNDAAALLSWPGVDGTLIGGASLIVNDFLAARSATAHRSCQGAGPQFRHFTHP